MKFRKDFVTNSSSSSYVCDVCNSEYSDMNASLRDAEMVQCENGHIFCIEHAVDEDGMYDWLHARDEEHEDYYYDRLYEIPKQFCPLCQGVNLSNHDMMLYLKYLTGHTKETALVEIKSRFKNIDEFYEAVTPKE